jgi:hypothetical protein
MNFSHIPKFGILGRDRESLRYYIRCFSQKCHELPKICDVDVTSAFWSGTTC